MILILGSLVVAIFILVVLILVHQSIDDLHDLF
jgi:hypothetical protein